VILGAPDGPTFAVGRSASGPDDPVLFPNLPAASGNAYDPYGGLCVILDYPA
jgi:hypothetical protein